MELLETISKRASVRQYKHEPIEKSVIEKLIDAGRRAPSARAVEPWDFVVITKKGVLQKLGEISSNGFFIKDATCCIAVFCKETKYYLEDGAAATENILLAATSLGLGACWVAGDKKPYDAEVSELLGAPSGTKLVSLISLGYPEKEIKQSKKRTLKEVLHWERF